MRITVASRVIGGFVIISSLLVILGISSIVSVSKIGGASEELSTLALPTVSGSAELKATFLNMGRLTFEGFVSDEKAVVEAKKAAYLEARDNFNSTLTGLNNVVEGQDDLTASVAQITGIYQEYSTSTDRLFESHLSALDSGAKVNSLVADLEEKIDDASSLLLDFSDLDEVSESDNLQKAADIGGEAESRLFSLFSEINVYRTTQMLSRTTTRSDDVRAILRQNDELISQVVAAASGEDQSGMLDEVVTLLSEISALIESNQGILRTKVEQLEAVQRAENYLAESDQRIAQGTEQLTNLNKLAATKAGGIKADVASSISTSMIWVFSIIVVSLIIASVIGFKSVRAITVPLAKVNELLGIASSGDLTHRLDDSSTDEFGQLAKNCNKLIDNLKDLIFSINQRADQLAAASGQTSTITKQTTVSIEDQKSQISQIAAATTEMHTTSELVSTNAEDTLKQIKEADNEAEKVKQISGKNKQTIQVLANDVEQAAEVINKLHQDSASIGGILDVIRGVADQTNLLALNAAIEAARAGEQGRGFAVVADEVRTLASRTQESTQEINSMIEVLQAGAEKAVAVMNQGKEQTVACVEQTEQAGEALNLITDAVHKAYEVSTRIEQAAREQNAVSSEISERLESIVGIAEQTTTGAQQTSESSAEVALLAGELQQSIGSFKV